MMRQGLGYGLMGVAFVVGLGLNAVLGSPRARRRDLGPELPRDLRPRALAADARGRRN